ncbi:MAG: FtsW/RodA/SpoVE family cell cycle protein [Paramuribaculum sp.]|nr:FtsW/RodA/SpoVE family cell cycle protein [Paramuribaculum sp.]
MTPKKAIAAYILTVIVFLLGAFSLYNNLEPQLNDAKKAIDEGETLVLEKDIDQKKLSDRLYNGGYLDNHSDADFVASRIKKIMNEKGSLPNLGSLLKPEFKVTADKASTFGGEDFQSRIKSDLYKLGVADEANNIINYRKYVDRQLPDSAVALISVKVKNAKGVKDTVGGIPVRIMQYMVYQDAKGNDSIATDTMGIKLTKASGMVSFKVKKGGFYSVLPIKKGFQYGREKGTAKGALSENLNISFAQRPHVLTLLSPQAFSNLKYDRTLVVRNPVEFKDSLISMAAAFILGWGVFFLFIFQLDKKSGTCSDYLLIIALMIISGIGLLTSYGIWNPLTDTLYGSVMTSGLLIGLVAMAAITLVNYAKLDARLSSSKWWILRNYGWTVLAGAFGLLCMLYFFGTGPEGSDAKVNLFGFQPSEISRVLIVIFIAWFFARKAMLIQDFSQRLTQRTFLRQLSTISWILFGMMVLMGAYMVLSDMGPALVVLISFILIYSMARRDFAQLLLGLMTFTVLMLGTRCLSTSLAILLPAAAIWFAGWGMLWFHKDKQIYESAILLNFVILVYSLAGRILDAVNLHDLADRFNNRTDMAWGGVWDNDVLGGDQVVQGIWSMATGGPTGLGLGNGSPAIVPAGHTDMIFTTIGEMLGLVGLVLVVLCFFVIVHRSLLIGRRAGYAFPFYLATGIGIVTGIQFLVIVAGSIGLLPLTGVTLPFLSYGRVSFIISLASFGFVVSISRLRANEIQRKYTYSFNGSIVACSGLFLLIAVILLGASARYQILLRGETLIRPAYVTNMEGARIIEYNPRIGLVLRKLEAGNIYDRNGLLLATSSIQELEAAKDSLTAYGVTDKMYEKEHIKPKRRYYPFGDHTLFMLGDYNTLKVFGYSLGNPIGYLAEARHLGDLRGIEIRTFPKELSAKKYKQNRFTVETEHTFYLLEHDYSNLLNAGFLNDGIERNPVIEAHNASRAKRDMKLTIDARLQMELQNRLAAAISNDKDLKHRNLLRASVVVLDAKNGDLLCSANYPLPNQDSIFKLNDLKIYGDIAFENKKSRNHQPITERDLGLTFQTQPGSTAKIMSAMAGFKKYGTDVTKVTYKVHPEEAIESGEPFADGRHYITIGEAIVKSSNNYFVNLVHDKDLYPQLDSIYTTVGVRVYPDSN